MSKANLNDPNLDKMKAADIPDVVGEYYKLTIYSLGVIQISDNIHSACLGSICGCVQCMF